VNDVRWSPTGDAIASASDDSTIRLFDLRADAELGCYQRKPVMFSCNSIDFSVSQNLSFFDAVFYAGREFCAKVVPEIIFVQKTSLISF